MIVDIKIDLDWLEGDGSVEELIQQKLIEQVVSQCLKKLSESIEQKAASKLDDAIDAHIASVLADLMNRQIKIADKYGTIQRTYENVDEMLDEKFENFLTEPVGKDGKPSDSCSYGNKLTRIDYLIDDKIKNQAQIKGQEIVKDTETKITQFFTKELQTRVAERLFQQLDLEKLLQK